jgi:hypothetical protein
MDCPDPETMATYLRGSGSAESSAFESHVRDCPACAIHLLLARETLRELGRGTGRLPRAWRGGAGAWLPWTAAAAVLVAALTAFLLRAPERAVETTSASRPAQRVVPTPPSLPPAEVPPPPPPVEDPVPVAPTPPAAEPATPIPAPPPPPSPPSLPPTPRPPPLPAPEPIPPPPPMPAPTVVERAVVARVTHSLGGPPPGRFVLAGDSLVTGRQEFLALSLEGYGILLMRENSKAEIGVNGAIRLADGGMLARLDPGRAIGPLSTPSCEIQIHSLMFDVQASKAQTDLSLIDGHASVGKVAVRGPAGLAAKAGRAAEPRPLAPGFASWIPEKLASRGFSSWTEGESFSVLQGFRALEAEGAFGGRAAVQTAEQGTAGFRSSLPFKGRHALWLRVRGYEAKTVILGLGLNGQSLGELKVEAGERPWRWMGPLVFTADRCDLVVAALSRFPRSPNNERNAFPVAVDGIWVTSDLKAKPETPGEKPHPYQVKVELSGE